MCYIILPVGAFVLLLWSTAAAVFGLWSTDWFVGDNIHMGIASGCPGSDSVTVPFTIPSASTGAGTVTPPATGTAAAGSKAYAKWDEAANVITKSYFSDDACTQPSGSEPFTANTCYVSTKSGAYFSVKVATPTTLSVCIYPDAACATNQGVQCYTRASGKCIPNDAAFTAQSSTGRRQADASTTSSDSTITFCSSVKWSYLNGTLEQIQGGLLIVAGGLGLIALILVIFEVVFRCCLKPTPMVPRLVALLALLQFIALGGMVIVLLGSNGWKTPPGTSFGPTLWANIIGIAAAFVAFVLMWLAAIAEKKAYKGRFKVFEQGKEATAQGGATQQYKRQADSDSTTQILPANEQSSTSLAGAPAPPPPPPPSN